MVGQGWSRFQPSPDGTPTAIVIPAKAGTQRRRDSGETPASRGQGSLCPSSALPKASRSRAPPGPGLRRDDDSDCGIAPYVQMPGHFRDRPTADAPDVREGWKADPGCFAAPSVGTGGTQPPGVTRATEEKP